MNDIQFDAQLIAAAPRSEDTNTFTQMTMKKIAALQPKKVSESKLVPWLQFRHSHRLAFAALLVVLVSLLTFSGYAYATGTDPITLLKRWIDGDKVKIEYDGRVFEHGRSRNYSDAAVTAYAEINTVNSLAFKAMQIFSKPRDGVEYVDDVYDPGWYEHPTIATINKVEGGNVALTERYVLGDKMNPSHDTNNSMVLPADQIVFYSKGEPATPTTKDVGRLVMLFPQKYIAHTIGTPTLKQIKVYFSFALSHELSAFKEADKANAEGLKPAPDAEQPLYEPGWGGQSTTCFNNGADLCADGKLSRGEGQGLYGYDHTIRPGDTQKHNMYNPNAIRTGEGVATQNDQPFEILRRDIEGSIVSMTASNITVKTSSGALWTLAYTQSQRTQFAKDWGSPLKVGDRLHGIILQSVRQLDSRAVDNAHIDTFIRI